VEVRNKGERMKGEDIREKDTVKEKRERNK
jgi:hypothetical protein